MLISLFVLSQTVVIERSTNGADQQEESKSSEKENTQQSSISEAVPTSTSQINLDFQSFLLVEMIFDEEARETYSFAEDLDHSIKKAIKVLLSKIISPNAP